MGLGNQQAAANIFEGHLQKYDLFKPEVKWYLSLCYLKMGKTKEAVVFLEEFFLVSAYLCVSLSE